MIRLVGVFFVVLVLYAAMLASDPFARTTSNHEVLAGRLGFYGVLTLGVGVLSLLLVHALALRWRDWLVKRSFLAVWLVFCVFAGGVAALGWALQAALGWQVPPTPPGLHQAGLAVGIYPALAWAMTRLHRAIGRAEEAA